ncbi:MAG TPA: TlpA disulfide reductase family protein [Gammaproteobacteria bacterium]|nr:TlpA disulfide reductase family protein [Gammaproteobacteria bacterium]
MRPAVVTAVLSAAAVAGYLSYRLAIHEAPPAEEGTTSAGLADTLPDFTLQNLEGSPQSIKTLAGKPLVINFWATWCVPCREEIPMLKTVQEQNPWLTVVGIAVDKRDDVLKYADGMKFNYPILMGESEAMSAASSFGVDFFALPFTVFADASGHLLGVHTGQLHPEHIENLVAVLKDLGEKRIDVATARQRLAQRM